MANTKKYLSHLLQNTGITPACSEEEKAASEVIAKVFENHGFTPEVQEFSASGSKKIVQAGLGIATFLGAVLMGIGGAIGIVGTLFAIAAAVLFVMERAGRPILSQLGSGGLSQNVIAYHKASGPLASPRNRPVVVVAHYDSPRVDMLSQQPYAAYRPILVKLLPFAMVAPAAIAVIRFLPFPDAAKIVLWILAVVVALIPLANAVAIIANRFVLPYTTGAVCNMSSIAAMLGVMDAVSPYELGEEFPHDMPADEYFAEQQRILEEAIAAAEAAAAAETVYPHELDNADSAESGENDEAVEGAEGEAGDAEGTTEFAALDLDAIPTADGAGAPLAAGIVGVAEAVEAADADSAEVEVDLGSTVAMSMDGLGMAEDEAVQESELEEVDDMGEAAEAEIDAFDPDATVAALPVITDEQLESAGLNDELVQSELDFEAEVSSDENSEAEGDSLPFRVNADGNIRFGADKIRALGMLPASCVFVYETEEVEDEVEPTAFEVEHEPVVVSFDDDFGIAPITSETADNEDFEPFDDEGFETELEETADEASVGEEAFEGDGVVESTDITDDEPLAEEESSDGEPEVPLPGETVQFSVQDVQDDEELDEVSLESTVAMPAVQVETVDSLMAEISHNVPEPAQSQRRVINVPSTADAPVPHTPASANRASLFDLPDPSATPLDPFAMPAPAPTHEVTDDSAAEARSAFTVINSNSDPVEAPETFDRIEAISAPVPAAEKPRRGLGRFFGRKKKRDDSMSEWLGVDNDFNAKEDGNNIGSWDNFNDDGWKGGAVGFEGATEEELREAIADMGDDELLGHDIWFVATGASENGSAGIQAFLDEHRDKLRGVFLINLESVGAGEVSMLATEGEQRVLKGDKRIMRLMQRVSADFHHPFSAVDMPYVTTDAHAAMSMSLRSLTIAGVDGNGFALAHTEDDQPYNLDLDNVAVISDVVTEVIRRS